MEMRLDDVKISLVEALEGFEIIDCHEHLGPEKIRTETPVDVFTLFSHYTRGDLLVAGMTEADYNALFDQRIPLERRWTMFKPYWEQIRWGSYARAALLAAEKFYGFADINDETHQPLSEAIQKANTPGIYERVLRDACNIRTAITMWGSNDLDTPLLTRIVPIPMLHPAREHPVTTWEVVSRPEFDHEASIRSLDDYLETAQRYIVRAKQEGAVGVKMASNPYKPPNRKEALTAFESLRSGTVNDLPWVNPLKDYVIDRAIAYATEQAMVIAVHTGYWGDFRKLDPLHMIPILQRHTEARFDIFHLGYPYVREALMLGEGFPNVWLNLCWTHIISQRFAVAALDEAVDLVPMNKLLAFGADYYLPVEKVYGHLVIAREDAAEVLARRIVAKQMSESQALDLARKWFWENPIELYRLDV